MSEIFEVGPNPSWDDILRFTTNIQNAEQYRDVAHTLAQANYFAAAAQVLVARRLDASVGLIQEYMMNAAQHVGKVTERGTHLMLDASNRAADAAHRQAEEAARHTRSLKRATWLLTVATVVLATATVALVFYTRALAVAAVKASPPPASVTSPR